MLGGVVEDDDDDDNEVDFFEVVAQLFCLYVRSKVVA